MDSSEQRLADSNLLDVRKENSGQLHPRLAWIMYYEQTRDPDAVCARFRISRKTFYKWLKRFRDSHDDTLSLVDHSRKPHHSPLATPKSMLLILREVKQRTGFGQRRLRAYLIEHYSITLSERTIWRLLKQDAEHSGSELETAKLI